MKRYCIQNSDGRYIEDIKFIDFTDNIETAVTFATKEQASEAITRMKRSDEWQFFDRGDKPKLTVKVAK